MAPRVLPRRRLLLASTSAAIAAFAFSAEARAADLTVPGHYASIGAALAVAANGDVIVVSDGTYTGANNTQLTISKSVTIRSVNGPASTILDTAKSYFFNASTGVTLQGFTVENADLYSAIFVAGTSTISNCVFKDNNDEEDLGAGAITTSGGSTTVTAPPSRTTRGRAPSTARPGRSPSTAAPSRTTPGSSGPAPSSSRTAP
jgi:hypothetical protein